MKYLRNDYVCAKSPKAFHNTIGIIWREQGRVWKGATDETFKDKIYLNQKVDKYNTYLIKSNTLIWHSWLLFCNSTLKSEATEIFGGPPHPHSKSYFSCLSMPPVIFLHRPSFWLNFFHTKSQQNVHFTFTSKHSFALVCKIFICAGLQNIHLPWFANIWCSSSFFSQVSLSTVSRT